MPSGSRLIFNDEIILSGDVLLDDYVTYMNYDDVYFSPRLVREALAMLGEGEVTVRLNSMGGHSDAGEAIRSILAAHPGGITIIVEGVAASAASLIFMAGKRRVMSGGSHLMIHDPSNYTFGNEEQMRRAADQIAVIANTYAAVYAAASGKTTEDVRAIMKAETWFGPEAAVAEGFADEVIPLPAGVTPPPPDMAAAKVVYMSANKRLSDRLSMQHPDAAVQPDRHPTATGGEPTTEISMPNPNPNAPTPNTPTPAPVTMSTQDAVAAERARVRSVREMAAPFLMSGRLTQTEVDTVIDEGVTLESAGRRFMTVMAANEPAGRTGPTATITRDETETRVEGMIGALMRQTEGPAVQYRGMRVKRLAMEMAGPKRGYDDAAAIRQGMMSTTMMGGAYGVSDFAYITTEVMRRTIIAEYERRNATWTLVTGTAITAADFREQHAVRVGGDFSLKPVAENGEYTQATLVDEGEGLRVERRGRTITLTFEAIVNDDMGAFDRIPRDFVIAARNMENSMVWYLFRKNAVLKSDKKALFHADHNNLATGSAAGVISPTSIAAARRAMWEQRPFGSKDKDDFLQLEADRLLVPPALELAALQFTAAVTAQRDGDVNPYKSRFQPATIPNLGAAAGGSDTAWYLVSSDRPPVQHAYLEGYEAPTVQTIEGMNPDVVKMNARHIFGAAATEYVGAYKNEGKAG